MNKDNESGIKSAYELAMERLEQSQGKTPSLSDEQKRAIAEVDNEMRAQIAELEITMAQRIAEAKGFGDQSKVSELEREKSAEIQRIRNHAEERKQSIRSSSAESDDRG